MDLWTELLALLSQVVTPIWNELIQYIPLLLFGLTPLVLFLLAWMWRHNGARNAPRIPPRLPEGQKPEGLHLPSPSGWPIVGAVGLFFIFAAIIFGSTTEVPGFVQAGNPLALEEGTMVTVQNGPNLMLLAIGLVVAAIAFAGWLMDAHGEYEVTEAGDHHLLLVAETEGRRVERPIPEGIHLPPPSGWPFLAPIGLFFAFLGFALGPVLIVGGLAMAAIAGFGWILDAGREYHEVADGAHADPAGRDPERAFPKRLVPVYVGIALISITLTLGNWMLSFLPKTEDTAASGPTPTTEPYVSAQSALGFDQRAIMVPADAPFTITFDNQEVGVKHNIEIFTDASTTDQYYKGENATGPEVVEYAVPAMVAGEYPFICSVHPNMQALLIVQ